LLSIALSHAPALGDHVGEHAKVGRQNYCEDPERFSPSGDVVTTEQIAKDKDEKPEPYDKGEYRQDVCQKICEGKASIEEHRYPPVFSACEGTGERDYTIASA
jgi:hypothetical protein